MWLSESRVGLPQSQTLHFSPQSAFREAPGQRSHTKAAGNFLSTIDLRGSARDTPAQSLSTQCPTWVNGALLPETETQGSGGQALSPLFS